jgi:hypothetical protein
MKSYETSNRKGCSQQKPGHTIPWDPLWGLQQERLSSLIDPIPNLKFAVSSHSSASSASNTCGF